MSDEILNENQNPQDDSANGMTADQQLQAKCEEYLAGWKRAQADYANLKRDIEKERTEYAKYANERLLSSLLPAVDQFEVALDFLPDTASLPEADRKRIDNWLVGIKAVRGLWQTAFSEIGLEHVSTKGAFDPMIHEAVGQEAVEGVADGDIVRCVQSGWKLNGKLLRPAKVIISQHSN